jgi:hypothetical protein
VSILTRCAADLRAIALAVGKLRPGSPRFDGEQFRLVQSIEHAARQVATAAITAEPPKTAERLTPRACAEAVFRKPS